METPSLLEAFEQADLAGKKALLQFNPPQEGFAEQYFLRVAQLLGENPVAARTLAEGWSIVNKYADDPSFAWRAKGALERIKGNWEVSAKAFVRSGNLARGAVSQLSFQTGAIDSLARAGKNTQAVRLGKSLATKLETMDEHALAGRAWLNTGYASMWADRHKAAKECFRKAFDCLKGSSFKLEAASALLGASSSALYIDLPSRSLALAAEARDEMIGLGATAYGNHAEVNVGTAHLMMGQADESVRIFSRLRTLVEPDSLEYARLGQFLGDAWLALQVYDAANNAFQSALASTGIRQSPINRGYCLIGLGDVRLHQGEASEARALYRAARKIFIRFGSLPIDNIAQIGVARSEIALGRTKVAKNILEQVILDLRSRKMYYYLVSALLDLASITQKNEPFLTEAHRVIRKFGFASEEWQIHSIRAGTHLDARKAITEYRKMVGSILSHRARLSSVTARTSLVEPCLVSIRNYLGLLIAANTKASTGEAIQVVSDLRSITLLDEFLLSEASSLSDSAQSILARIRQEVTAEGGDQLPGGPLRFIGKGVWSKPSLVREYLEQVGLDRIGKHGPGKNARSEVLVNTFVFLQKGSAWLSRSNSRGCSVTKEDLVKRLRWIHFELMSPLSGFASDDARLNRELDRLRTDLSLSSLDIYDDLLHLSLEDVAYQVPWSLLSPHESVLHLRPSAGISPSRCFLGNSPKIGVWYYSRPELPHIDSEVQKIRTMFPQAKVYSTVEEIMGSVHRESFDLIHVAAHGRYDHENPMFSSIQLADGHLLACDIARSSFRTRIATLASCDSASMGQPTGWEPQGLARAFLARQSEVVIGSLWPLNDQAAEYGFGTFYRKLQEGLSVSSSLNEARNDLKEKFTHPAFWGSLVMFGGYAS